MATIDIGSGATDRADYMVPGNTVIDPANPANDTGKITSFEIWFEATQGNGAGVKIGTFSGSGTSYDDRDYETIGTVTAGSKQTFSGLSCDVVTGDVIGIYETGGRVEVDTSGGSGRYYKAGDQFGTGAQTYTLQANWAISIYGTGATAGWAHIAEVNAVAAAAIAEINGVAVAAIAEINGVAV